MVKSKSSRKKRKTSTKNNIDKNKIWLIGGISVVILVVAVLILFPILKETGVAGKAVATQQPEDGALVEFSHDQTNFASIGPQLTNCDYAHLKVYSDHVTKVYVKDGYYAKLYSSPDYFTGSIFGHLNVIGESPQIVGSHNAISSIQVFNSKSTDCYAELHDGTYKDYLMTVAANSPHLDADNKVHSFSVVPEEGKKCSLSLHENPDYDGEEKGYKNVGKKCVKVPANLKEKVSSIDVDDGCRYVKLYSDDDCNKDNLLVNIRNDSTHLDANNKLSRIVVKGGNKCYAKLYLNDNYEKHALTVIGENGLHFNEKVQSGLKTIGDFTGVSSIDIRRLDSSVKSQKDICKTSFLGHGPKATELIYVSNEMTDLEGIEMLTELEELYLHTNKITDITPLSKLIKLEILYLQDNEITDLSPLSELTKLKKLSVADNNLNIISSCCAIKDINGLEVDGLDCDGVDYDDCEEDTSGEICDNFYDDDNDNLIDCDDQDCVGEIGINFPEQDFVKYCSSVYGVEKNCDDKFDNDGDGDVDGDDSDCGKEESKGTCTETDDGKDLINKGTTTGLGPVSGVTTNKEDHCTSYIQVIEYYCDGDIVAVMDQNPNFLTISSSGTFCPKGMHCKDGACGEAEICDDGKDNDDDKLIDCADPDCSACSGGKTCVANTLGASCCAPTQCAYGNSCKNYDTTEEVYGLSDALICGSGNLWDVCTKKKINDVSDGGKFTCNGKKWVAKAFSGEICDDGKDNDDDKLIDCADPDCSACSGGKTCVANTLGASCCAPTQCAYGNSCKNYDTTEEVYGLSDALICGSGNLWDVCTKKKINDVSDGGKFTCNGKKWVANEEEIAPEEITPEAVACGGTDANHACVTDGKNPSVFKQTGDKACSSLSLECEGLEMSCHNVHGGKPSWNSLSTSCSSTSVLSLCVHRAVCIPEEDCISDDDLLLTINQWLTGEIDDDNYLLDTINSWLNPAESC